MCAILRRARLNSRSGPFVVCQLIDLVLLIILIHVNDEKIH